MFIFALQFSIMSITTASIVSRKKEGLLVSEVGNEIVMMDIESGNYIGLNETGKAIWALLEQPVQVADLINTLVAEYDISHEICSADTLAYLNKMAEQKILITA